MTTTTITFDSILWDRLNTQARLRGQTAGRFVEDLLDAWLREQRFAQIRRAMAETPRVALEAYRDETAGLDALAGDGLDEGSAGDVLDEEPAGP
jgi:hypothetical protein